MMLFILTWISTISISLSCLVSVDDIYLSDISGDTIIIAARNSNNPDNAFSHPRWRIYINNVEFGKDESSYFAINSDYSTEFPVVSNTTNISPGDNVSFHLELYTNVYSQLECTFDSIGTINTINISNMTTSILYPYINCPATLERIYTDDSTGTNLIIEISNDPNPTTNPRNDIFSYPYVMVHIVNNNYFGKSTMDFYGIGSYNQSFPVMSNITTISLNQPVNLSIGLYIILPVRIKACTFEWTGSVRVITTTEQPTTTQGETSATNVDDTTVWCTDSDDTTSCGDGTCQCAIGAKCKNDECIGFGNPNGKVKLCVLQVVACMVVSFFSM